MTQRLRVLVVHGPNLGDLGQREPARYGSVTLEALDRRLRARGEALGCDVTCVQSDAESTLAAVIRDARGWAHGLVLNPGGLTHTSVVLRDAVLAAALPAVECHVTHPEARESFRRRSLVAAVCLGRVSGLGPGGYLLALDGLVAHLRGPDPGHDA